MRLVAVEFVTLDGVIQAPGHAGEDPDGFSHGGWSQPYFADHARHSANAYRAAAGFLFGRTTFEIFAGYWPTVTDPADPIAHALNTRPKYVVSSTLTNPAWQPTTVVSGDITERIAELKRQRGGDLLVVGSSQLAQRLVTDRLIDEYQLWVHPVVVGSGKRLFPATLSPLVLDLVDATVTSTGLLIATYQPACATRNAA